MRVLLRVGLLLLSLVSASAGCADGAGTGDDAPSSDPTSAVPTHGSGAQSFLSVLRSDAEGRRVLDVEDVRDAGREGEVRRLAAAAGDGHHEEPRPEAWIQEFLEALHRDWEAANPGGAPETRSNPIAVRIGGATWLFAWAAVTPA